MVPQDLKNKISEAKVIEQGKWAGGFQRPGILDPTTKLFSKIADTYYTEMKNLYGEDIHYFGGEPFHEGGKTNGLDLKKCCGKYSDLYAKKATLTVPGFCKVGNKIHQMVY